MNLVCKVCNKPFERKNRRGPPPQTCYDCKAEAKAASIKAVQEKYDTRVRTATGLTTTNSTGSNVTVTWNEPSWLDAPEVQEKLAERNLAKADKEETTAEPDHHEVKHQRPEVPDRVHDQPAHAQVVGEDTSLLDETVGPENDRYCVAPGCEIPVYDYQFGGRFCAGHWRLLDLNTRGVLLGAAPGTPVFEQTVQRAVRSLR